jgi:hypothetical protein
LWLPPREQTVDRQQIITKTPTQGRSNHSFRDSIRRYGRCIVVQAGRIVLVAFVMVKQENALKRDRTLSEIAAQFQNHVKLVRT